jgi:hypothetical protein
MYKVKTEMCISFIFVVLSHAVQSVRYKLKFGVKMKNLKIPKGYTESVNQINSDNTMAKENGQEQPSAKQYT